MSLLRPFSGHGSTLSSFSGQARRADTYCLWKLKIRPSSFPWVWITERSVLDWGPASLQKQMASQHSKPFISCLQATLTTSASWHRIPDKLSALTSLRPAPGGAQTGQGIIWLYLALFTLWPGPVEALLSEEPPPPYSIWSWPGYDTGFKGMIARYIWVQSMPLCSDPRKKCLPVISSGENSPIG